MFSVLKEAIISSGFDFRPVNGGGFVIPVKIKWSAEPVAGKTLPTVDDVNKVRRFVERLGDDGFDFNFEEYERESEEGYVVTVFHIQPVK